MLQFISGNKVVFLSVISALLSFRLLVPDAVAQTESQSTAPTVSPAPDPADPAVAPAPEPAQPATPSKEEDLLGHYGAADGTQAGIYRSTESGEWVMTYARPGEKPMTVFLAGDPASLKPVGLDITTTFNGKPMTVIGEGAQLYVKGSSEEEEVEGLVGATGKKISVADGTSEGAELSAALQDYSAEWNRLRAARVQLARDGMKIISAGTAVSSARAFSRRSNLSNVDVEAMKSKLTARARGLKALDAFSAREVKLEVKP